MNVSRNAQRQIKTLIEAGLSPEDLAPVQNAVDQLRKYEGLGAPDVFLKMSRRSDVLAEYIKALPDPVQAAWVKLLEERKAF